MNRQQQVAPEKVFEVIPELEFKQTENLSAEVRHDGFLLNSGFDA